MKGLYFFFFTILTFQAAAQTPPKYALDLCDVYNQPIEYVDKDLELTAFFVLDINMPPLIWGDRCENKYILVSVDKKEKRDQLVDRLFQIQSIEQLGMPTKIRFKGKLTKNRREGHVPIKGALQNYTFVIEKVIHSPIQGQRRCKLPEAPRGLRTGSGG